jgi:hypothetical protein
MICPVTGGVIAGGGGIVVSGSQITDAVLSKKRRSSAENIVKKYKSRVEFLMKECVEIGTLLQDYGDIDANFPSWVRFWGNIALRSATGIKSAGWNVIGSTILDSLRIVSYVDDVMSTGAAVTTTAFKTIGSTTGRALHVAGGVFGILLLPIDIHTLVASSIDVHKTNPHKTSEKIREMAAAIKAKCPTREDIDGMVEETVATLSHV